MVSPIGYPMKVLRLYRKKLPSKTKELSSSRKINLKIKSPCKPNKMGIARAFYFR
jgi:hypothetical protein